jgi:hypothetical protein
MRTIDTAAATTTNTTTTTKQQRQLGPLRYFVSVETSFGPIHRLLVLEDSSSSLAIVYNPFWFLSFCPSTCFII